MANLPFFILDVFAQAKFQGNQLGVVLDADDLTGEQMHTIAREMNYSETTFILSREERDGGYDVRIFTPGGEVPFAGHPTLGTAWVIQQELIGREADQVVLNLKAGRIPVTMSYDNGQPTNMWMRQIQPTFGRTVDKPALAAALKLTEADMDPAYPVEEVSTGLPFIICPLADRSAVERAKVDLDKFFALVEDGEAKMVHIFCRETVDPANQIHARMYGHAYEVPEDPATGSANGCLAAYLVKHKYLGSDVVDCRVEQGVEMGRPSLLLLKAKPDGDEIEINVGGRAVVTAKGELFV